MERLYLEKLERWLTKRNRKPLLIYGARQVGKTTLVKDIFAPLHFEKVIYVDFKIDHEARVFIKNNVSAHAIVNYLSIRNNVVIDEKTLIIFDEIQECVPCITSLKYFEQDYKSVPVIATGSMVRIRLKQLEYQSSRIRLDPEIERERQDGVNNFMFPTGKIEHLNMYPMAFGEYLNARNKMAYQHIKEAYSKKEPLDPAFHKMAMDYVYEFLCVGGMPEVVQTFLDTDSFVEARKDLARLYSDYLADMALYQISQETIMRTRALFNNVYAQLNKENKNYKISLIEPGKRNRDYLYPMDWLAQGRIVFKSNQLKERVTLPLREESESLYRVYLSDLGLLAYQSGLNGVNFLDASKRNDLAGLFFENFAAIEFGTRGIPLFYWKGKTTSEFEFVLNLANSPVVVDAKKNKGSLASLEVYRRLNPRSLAIKVSGNGYGFDESQNLLTLPFYYLGFFLDENLDSIQQTEEI